MSRTTVRCRHCEEPIVFVTSKKGKRIPCDPDLTVAHLYLRNTRTPKEESICVVTPDGTTIVGVKAKATEVGTTRVEGYLAHRASCMGEGRT